MLVIELVSKWEICWALWSLVLFDPVRRPDPTRIWCCCCVFASERKNYSHTLYFFFPNNSEIPTIPWT